jgi:hypothetical protein
MPRGDERSLSDLKRGAERTRAEFTETVDQLRCKVSDTVTEFRERVSPDAIKAEVSDYFRTRGQLLLDKARSNPLQAAAIGAGLAYPLLGIVRSIPAPVLMVGAGLFLLSSRAGQSASRKLGVIAGDVSDQIHVGADAVRKIGNDAQEMASDGMASAQEAISSGVNSFKRQASTARATLAEGAGELRRNAADFVSSASDGMDDLKQKASEAVGATAETLRNGAATTSSIVQNAAESASEFGTEIALKIRDRAVETSQTATTTVTATIQRNPLLVGGIGLAIGMLIASVLPRSDIEKGIMGGASADVQKRADELASKGLETAKGIASSVLGDVSDQADQEGLTPTGLNAAAEDLGRRVRKVAENATTAAFELSPEKAPTTQRTYAAE